MVIAMHVTYISYCAEGNCDAELPSGTIRAIIMLAAHFAGRDRGQTIGGIKDSDRAGKLRSDNDFADRRYSLFLKLQLRRIE